MRLVEAGGRGIAGGRKLLVLVGKCKERRGSRMSSGRGVLEGRLGEVEVREAEGRAGNPQILSESHFSP